MRLIPISVASLFIFVLTAAAPALAQDAVTDATAPAVEAVEAAEPVDDSVRGRISARKAKRDAEKAKRAEKAAEDDTETLLGHADGEIESGGYGGPQIKFGRIAGSDAVFVGGRGGWIVNSTFVIGAAGYGMVSRPDAPDAARSSDSLRTGTTEQLGVGYGGMLLEYIVASSKLLHVTFGTVVGAGGLNIGSRESHMRDDNFDDTRNDSFWIIEPEVHAELNMTKFLRVGLGGTYRVVTGVNGLGLENEDLRGPSGSLIFKFGSF